jgi:hypothetical protein
MMVIVSCKRYLILVNILFSSSPSFCILILFDLIDLEQLLSSYIA